MWHVGVDYGQFAVLDALNSKREKACCYEPTPLRAKDMAGRP
jgi:hypothetical protein